MGVYVGIGAAAGALPKLPEETCAVSDCFSASANTLLGVGSTGTGAAVEQASTKIPKSTARTAVSFIPLPTGLSASNGILTAYVPGVLEGQYPGFIKADIAF